MGLRGVFMGRIFLGVFLLLATFSVASAEVPRLLHYQGYLTNVTGDPVDCPDAFNCNQSFTFTYRIYNQELGGDAQWLEAHTNVPIYQGAFHSLLGGNSSIVPEVLGDEAWLSIEINGEGEMSPRQRVASSAFALRADTASEASNAEKLGGIPAVEYITVDTTLSDDEVLSIVSGAGYVTGPHTVDTTLSEDDVLEIVNSGGYVTGPHTVDTTLNEDDVDGMVANNGYAVQEDLDTLLGSLATVASSASFDDLINIPAGLTDGDDDTVGSLTCAPGEVAQFNGSAWVCSNAASGVGTTEPAPCSVTTVGRMYFDVDTNSLRLCDGSAYRKIKICTEACPPASTIACGLPVEDDCGTSCSELGTALNSNQCATASTILCGTPIVDDCGNSCGSGTALDDSECDAVSTACGSPVQDSCGNACGVTGSFCSSSTDKCESGVCIASCGDGVLDPGEECDTGGPSATCSATCTSVVNVTFTNCGNSGRSGPSQTGCDASYSGSALEGMVTLTGGIQNWTVPATATYRITVQGAQGGDGSGTTGGLGARIRGDFNLTEGTTLRILVGQKGSKGPSCSSDCLGGGGGGSFVFLDASDAVPIIAAGGGGGANYSGGSDGGNANGGESGSNGLAESTGGGSGGQGGGPISCGHYSGAGAGWLSNGAAQFYSCEGTGTVAQAPRNGGTGGRGNEASSQTGEGGFGGGGGSAVECGQTGGGGGGGYSGGGPSSCCSSMSCGGPGGGGGSYNSGSSQENIGASNAGHGQVAIEKL